MLTIISFLVTLGVLITIHEYGHYQVARWCGVKVLRFSLGFGKPFFTRKFGRDHTEFVVAALPLGGYVKMLDEREMTSDEKLLVSPQDMSRAFNRQTVWKRIAIVSAGPIANLLLAIFLYWILFMHGVIGLRPVLDDVLPNTPAAQASLHRGDVIKKIAGEPVASWQDVRWEILKHVIKSTVIEIETVSESNGSHTSNLSLVGINQDDFESDFLEKLGLKPYQPIVPAKIGEVLAGSAAEKAGLQAGDEVLSIDGLPISNWESVVSLVRKNPSHMLHLTLKRGQQLIQLPITPEATNENGQKIGRIGAAYRMSQDERDKILVNVQYSPATSLIKAVQKTWETSMFSLKMLGKMLMGESSWKGLSGPVTIASYAGESAHLGWIAFLGFLATISISLGVLNLLPIPVLDGGHLLYYMVETLKGSPVSEHVMEIGQRVGISVLGMLMICAIYNDFNRAVNCLIKSF